MAIKTETITINVSDYTLNINGNSNVSGTISWSSPSLPDGYSIISQTLTGTMEYGGSGKLNTATINGTTNKNEGSFNISLGTSLKTSVSVTGRGQNKNATGPLNFTGMVVTIQYQYEEAVAAPPVITIMSQDVYKISSVNGHDRCVVTFTSDQPLTYWEARATTTQTPSHGVGLLIESGALNKSGDIAYIYVENEELTSGDLTYRIDIYGQNSDGVWSDD